MERRRESAATVETLEALRRDVAEDRAQFERTWAPSLAKQERARQELEAFLDGTPIADSVQFVRDVREVATYGTFDFNTTSMEGLQSTGQIDLISDARLRAEILSYHNNRKNTIEFDILHRAAFIEWYARLGPEIVGGLALPKSFETDNGEGHPDQLRTLAAVALDAAAIRNSDDLRRLLVATGQPFFIKKVQYRALATQADELRTLLDAALDSE